MRNSEHAGARILPGLVSEVKIKLKNANVNSKSCDVAQRNVAARSKEWVSPLVRLVFFLVAVVLGWLLVELPWNESPLAISASHVFANLHIVALLGSVLFFLGQRTRVAMATMVGLCLLVGVANFYVIAFKGQPIVPADLFALSTAASVSSGYSLFLTWRLGGCFALFGFYCFALYRWCPKRTITKQDVFVNVIVALLLAVVCGGFYQKTDIKQEYDVKVDVWDVRGSYASQGTLLCFLSRAQELVPHEPADYSDEVVAAILEPYRVSEMGTDPEVNVVTQLPASVESGSDSEAAVTSYDGPNVVVVMNETFSDLSSYPGLEGTNAQPEFFKSVQEDSLVAGDVYTSAMGGGTCNSEFEFLTGTSMGLLGAGVYPYVLYDLESVENLASYFHYLGYETSAIHPAEASNWRRDVIYAQFGFDSFDDITTMEGADTFRNLVTDKATYERVLEKLDAGDDPQFVFDVTIQNHGGYTTGLVPMVDRVHLDSNLVKSAEMDEFLAAIQRSDDDLRWFIDELNSSDEPTILVFFGGHQPGFADELFEVTFEIPVDEATAEEVQARYHTPFFIWANAAAREMYGLSAIDGDALQMVTSLNYLGALLLEAAELPQPVYTRYLNALRDDLPVVNLNGYQDRDGIWHWFGETPTTKSQAIAEEALDEYGIVQYEVLFNE